MIILVALILTVLTFAFVAYPLFKQRSRSVEAVEDERLRELHSERDTTYSMLKELEFDFQSGILTDEDYQDLEARYKRKAVSILRNMDTLEKGTEIEEEIERQVQEWRGGQGKSCPQCGVKYQEEDRFCSHCGTRLSQGGSVD